MKQVTRTIYEAEDGTIFDNEADCMKHEADAADRAKRTSYWSVTHSPDLTEGRGHYGCDLIEVFGPAPYYHEELMQDYCFRSYGRKVQFVQGCAPMTGWMLTRIERDAFLSREPESRVGDYAHKGKRIKLVMGKGEKGLVPLDPLPGDGGSKQQENSNG